MKFEIPFVENIFREQMKLNFDFIWKKNIKKNNTRLIYFLGFLLVGLLLLNWKKEIAICFLSMAFFYFLICYSYYSNYLKYKKIYYKEVNDLVERYMTSNKINIWEFNNDYFRYKDFRFDLRANWSEFKGFKVVENNIFISLDSKNLNSFLLGKEEVGLEAFEKLIKFLNVKVKGQIPIQDRAKD